MQERTKSAGHGNRRVAHGGWFHPDGIFASHTVEGNCFDTA